tara:strand:- start:1048 stop:1530 length:483 start_codon:yes stop_codon:yes gene_type:complete
MDGPRKKIGKQLGDFLGARLADGRHLVKYIIPRKIEEGKEFVEENYPVWRENVLDNLPQYEPYRRVDGEYDILFDIQRFQVLSNTQLMLESDINYFSYILKQTMDEKAEIVDRINNKFPMDKQIQEILNQMRKNSSYTKRKSTRRRTQRKSKRSRRSKRR